MKRLLAVLLATSATLAGAASAGAQAQWHDGVSVQSTIYNPCLHITEAGAIAQAAYQSDPASTHPGDVFYAHALFGAATVAGGGGCGTLDQAAELEVVLPPGVSLAIDAQHPVRCFFQDDGATTQTNPTCPTHAIPGTYGPQFPAGDGGAGWDMVVGRTLEVQFPLASTRELKGPAGGHCPQTLDELGVSQQRDCLLIALHVLDGTDDPWLLPDIDMVIAPGAATTTTPQPAPVPAATPIPTAVHATLTAPQTVRLASLRSKGLLATLTVPENHASATLTLRQGNRTLGTVTRHNLDAGQVNLRVRLSKAGQARLRHASSAKLTLIAKLSTQSTPLQDKVLAKR